MILILQKIAGILLICVAILIFTFSTTNLNKAQSIGGLMSGAFSTVELITLTAVLNAVAICLALAGVKLTALERNSVGLLLVLTSVFCLVLGVVNHINSPSNDGGNDTGKIPVDASLHILTYLITATCLFLGGYFLKKQKNVCV